MRRAQSRHGSAYATFRTVAAFVALSLAGALPAVAQDTKLTVESWRPDDAAAWRNAIVPAFQKEHPGTAIAYQPTTPTEYDAALTARLEGGTAGDLIICRPFDKALELYKAGHLLPIDDWLDLSHYPAFAKAPWQTDDGKTTFCLPVASVLHGFMYSKPAFQELGLTLPKTMDEFHRALEKIKADGRYVPLAMGTADQWETSQIAYQNIGPMYWNGEEGRLALIEGTKKLTDREFVRPWQELASWRKYLGDGFEARKYADSQTLFTLGRAAIYPTGSWEIGIFREQAGFDFGAFPPPLPEGQTNCYINDHPDFGIGINPKSKNLEAAKAFMKWAAGATFAEVHANSVPGFFPLADYPVKLKDPVAQQFIDWRQNCRSSMRMSYQKLSRGTPTLENELWVIGAQVMNGTMSPEDAAAQLQKDLAGWYKPQQK